MKKYIVMLLCCLLILVSAVASACGPRVLIPDSDTRLLTTRELNTYSYDGLGYALNEILARHGYHFDYNGKYYEHFSYIEEYDPITKTCTYFYEEAPDFVSNDEIYANLSRTEQKNIRLIKDVRAQKKARGEYIGEDYSLWMCSDDNY